MPGYPKGFDGAGLTITSTGGFTATIKSINADPAVSVSKLELTGVDDLTKVFRPGTVKEFADMAMTVIYDPDYAPPVGVEDAFTIQFPKPIGQVAGQGARLVVTGFFQNWEPSGAEAGGGSLMEASTSFVVNSVVRTQSTVS
jgi:hypothetical protein